MHLYLGREIAKAGEGVCRDSKISGSHNAVTLNELIRDWDARSRKGASIYKFDASMDTWCPSALFVLLP